MHVSIEAEAVLQSSSTNTSTSTRNKQSKASSEKKKKTCCINTMSVFLMLLCKANAVTLYSSDLESHRPSTESVIGSIDEGGALLGQGVYLGVRPSRFGNFEGNTQKVLVEFKKLGDVVEAAGDI